MSLESLFNDRRNRKYVIDSVNEAVDAGKGVCQNCANDAHLIHVFGKNLCEKCCESLTALAKDYDIVLESVDDDYLLSEIKEGYVVPDLKKLQADANAKFGGSIPKLMQSYGLKTDKDWDDRFHKGWIYFWPNDLTSGKTHINQFIIDYSVIPAQKNGFDKLAPDADGTFALSGKAPGGTSVPKGPAKATTSAPTKQSSSSSVTQIGAGYIGGNIDHFQIQVGQNSEIDAEKVTGVSGNEYKLTFDTESVNVSVSDDVAKDFKKLVDSIKNMIIKNPKMLFKSFSDIDANGSIVEIDKYNIYKFAVDDYSFGKIFTMAPVYKDKVHSKERIHLSDRALSSKVALSSELTDYLDSMVRKKYPVLVDGKNKFRTSMGIATFELDSIEDSGIVNLIVDLDNKKFKGRVDGTRLSSESEGKDAFAEIVLNYLMQSVFNDKAISKGIDSYQVNVKNGSKSIDFTVYAQFDTNSIYNSGDITFGISIIDTFSGEEQPKKRENFVYRKLGTPLKQFLIDAGMDIYKRFFRKSNMVGNLTQSAQDKMKNPSKKQALFRKISDKLQNRLVNNWDISQLEDCEVEASIDVDNMGRVTKAYFTVTDPYNDVANDSKELASTLKLEKKCTWIKIKKIDTAMKDGPSVTYEVTDIDPFANLIDLRIMEGMILEAFGIVTISESSNRKVFHV